ncbi:MAG: response regulator [Syntrophobacteraceae bacterium]|nr:response regulator [Desulfobacteraceae bacterium]
MSSALSSTRANVYIIDDEQQICQIVDEFVGLWGMNSESYTNPVEALERIRDVGCDVVLLDVFMPEANGLEVLPRILKVCPDAKVIIMTGYADKETAINALKLGAFDFLEKPLQSEILSHAIRRAIDAQKKERNLKKVVEDLKTSQAELLTHRKRLEALNIQLMETNKALSIFAQNIEREKDETEKRIATKLRSIMVPTIDRLRRDKRLAGYGVELDMLVTQIEDITSGFSADAKVASILSNSELRIASLIKNGLTTEEVAEQLNISINTVRTHRKNIRKKLKINNVQYSLRNFLRTTRASSGHE